MTELLQAVGDAVKAGDARVPLLALVLGRGGVFTDGRLASLSGERLAVIGLAESGCLGVILGAEPAIWTRQRWLARARLKMIDADVAGDAGAERILALDAAA